MKIRPVGPASILAVTLVAAILMGSQFLANAGSPAPDVNGEAQSDDSKD